MNLSYTKVATFRQCPMKYKWKYIDGLEPITRQTHFKLGSIVHKAFEEFYKGQSDQLCLDNIIKSFDREISSAELSDQESLLLAKHTAIGMWKNNPFKTGYKDYKAEQDFTFRIGRLNFKYVGRVDGLFTVDGKRWVREFKTTSDSKFENKIGVSQQATGNIFAFRDSGVFGAMYDIIMKPKLYKKQTENAEQLAKRIEEDYKWRPDFYFKRKFTYRSPVDMENFKKDTVAVYRSIKNMTRTGRFYRNCESCYSFNAECPYMKICFSEKPDPLTVELMFKKKEYHE